MVIHAADSPSEYLAVIEDDWRREKLFALREVIFDVAPDWPEVIHYKMLGYGPEGDPTMHVNVQKARVCLYVGDIAKVDPSGELLAGMDMGKGCVRFRRKDDVGGNVRVFLERYVAMKRDGVDVGC